MWVYCGIHHPIVVFIRPLYVGRIVVFNRPLYVGRIVGFIRPLYVGRIVVRTLQWRGHQQAPTWACGDA